MEKVSSPKARGAGTAVGFSILATPVLARSAWKPQQTAQITEVLSVQLERWKLTQWQFVAASSHGMPTPLSTEDGEEVAVKVIKGNDLTQEAYPLLMGCLLECNKLPGGFFSVSITHVALFNGIALTFEETEMIREQGLATVLPVSPKAKLATTWGKLKSDVGEKSVSP